jgi:hypothetical protein
MDGSAGQQESDASKRDPMSDSRAAHASGQPGAGWRADPTDRHDLRYFDGDAWTRHVADGKTVHVDPQPIPEVTVSNPTENDIRYDIDPAGLAVALLGSLAALIAVFLPRVESPAFLRIEHNTLIQSGDGYWIVGFAIALAAAAYRARSTGVRAFSPYVFGCLILAIAIYEGTNEGSLTLSRISLSGDPVGGTVKASPAIGIYLAGIGGALGIIGTWRMRRDSPRAVPEPVTEPTKRCPDCAETIMAAANVCRYCGRRFDGTATPTR